MANRTQFFPLKIVTFYHDVPLIFKFVYKGFLDHVARAAGNVFKYICLFLIGFLNQLARAAGKCFIYELFFL